MVLTLAGSRDPLQPSCQPLADIPSGCLLQGMRPDIARLFASDVVNKVWFGPRGNLRRHGQAWLIADTLLPLDPAKLPDVRVEE